MMITERIDKLLCANLEYWLKMNPMELLNKKKEIEKKKTKSGKKATGRKKLRKNK